MSLNFLSFFTRPRLKDNRGAPVRYAPGTTFSPGVASLAYESTLANPTVDLFVHKRDNFVPLRVTESHMMTQSLALPPQLPQGFVFGGLVQQGLIDASQLPDLSGDYYG